MRRSLVRSGFSKGHQDGRVGLPVDTGNARQKHNLGYARTHEDQDKGCSNSHFQMPLALHGGFAEPRGSCGDQANNRCVESLKYPLDIRQVMKTVVRDCEANHH